MIRQLESITNLTIVGMSVVVPDGGGIEEFGKLIYRGLPVTGHFGDGISLESAIVQSIQQVCGEARLENEQVAVVSLSPSLGPIFQENGIGSKFQEVSGISAALTMASDWLESNGEDVVLLVECQANPQTVCSILVAEYKSAVDNSKPIYAFVASAAEVEGPLSATAVSGVLQEVCRGSHVRPEAIGLIGAATLMGDAIHTEEAEGLLGGFSSQILKTCALGGSQAGLLGIVKTAWCLSNRILPGVPGWGGLLRSDVWQQSPFYVTEESRAWFIPSSQDKRYAGLNILSADDKFTNILFCDTPSAAPHHLEGSKLEAMHLFPIGANSVGQLLEKMTVIQTKLAAGTILAEIARDTYQQNLLGMPTGEYVTGLLGQTPDELIREIGFALKGIPMAIEKQSDWKTPLGSFFTSHPLGKDGKISFVYPGAFNSYPGVGRDLFYLFPTLYDRLSGITSDIGDLLNERMLYPRSITALTAAELIDLEAKLNADPITMLISGSCLAFLYTDILRNVFEIHPASAFGYSLGEVSMMFASGVWTDADGTSKALRESPLFRTRLTGPQNAVREYWDLPTRSEDDSQEVLWVNFLLMTGPEKVKEALAEETHVYLTHINTPRQVVIGGDPAGCRRVIDRLKCKSLQAPFNYAIHCEPIQSEYDMLAKLHSVPVMNEPGMILYSAATFQPMPIDREKIAQYIAHELCNCLDFPRLIRLAYNDGARIFIELGAGSNCARWVNDTLESQPHAAYSINRKGVDDYFSFLRLMAHMISHHVPVNLSSLYQA